MAHYTSSAEARKNYYKLLVGDTFDSGEACSFCGALLIGYYDATATLQVPRHQTGECIVYLANRIKSLEEKAE